MLSCTDYVENDVIMNNKSLILAPWEAYDLNPDKLPTYEAEKGYRNTTYAFNRDGSVAGHYFKEHPVFGIGLGQFAVWNPLHHQIKQ